MINAAIWSFATQYGQMVLGFATSVILARLLSPEEIGIYSVSFALIGFATIFRTFGVGEYLVQEKELSAEKLQTAFTTNVLVSWSLGTAVYFSGDPVSQFYGTAEVATVFHVLAVNFLFVPFGAITLGVLRRDMKFKALAHVNLIAILVSGAVSVVSALAGQSYLSMAWGAVAGSLCTALLSQKYRTWSISIRPNFAEFRSVWAYSSYSLLFNLIRYTSNSLAEILTGKFLGMVDVGLLSKGRSVPGLAHRLISGGLKPVTMPEFAKLREDPKLLSTQYFKIVDVTLVTVWPSLVFMGFMAEEIVLFLFGEKWIPITPIVQIASFAAALWAIINYVDELLKATGKIRLLSRLEPVFLVLSALAAIIGSQYSIVTLVSLGVVVGFIRVVIYMFLLKNLYLLRFRSQFLIIGKNLFVIAPLGAVLCASSSFFVIQSPGVSILFNGLVFLMCWIVLLVLSKHYIYQMLRLFIKNFLASR